ncbi:P-loop ATPase, Sll1717 family [Kitasatospora sp. NPDC052868]|uniref:P-loop ATPase, Sll1717 family n=1 Tax=Kitasatospora sp. NPDC052868 TaxID=3364060 RepID=UPI0037C60D0D
MVAIGDFRSFDFGYSDAGSEFQRAPKLLREGYYDLGGIEDRVLSSHEFLLLGYKGSGKSAIASRLRLLANDSPALYSVPDAIHIDRLPLKEFRGVVPDSIDSHIRHRFVWELHLLIHVTASLAKDGQAERKHRKSVGAAQEQLEKYGVTPQHPSEMKRLRTNKVTASAGLPQRVANVSAEFNRSTDASTLDDWITYLRDVASTFRSQRKHYLFIDGLDDISLIQESRSSLLGGLIQAAADLNELFSSSGAPVKIVVCCRTDLYSRLMLPRAGKIRSDDGLELNWYQNTRDFQATHLVKLANLRARLVDRNCANIFQEFFPDKIGGRDAVEFILLQTRHTPRDLLQLLKIVKGHVAAPGAIPEDTVKAGTTEYSATYFIGEFRDALNTYFDPEQVRRIEDLLGSLRKRQFTYAELRAKVDNDARFKDKFDLENVLAALFDSSFIGNVTPGGATGGYEQYYRFKYRNPLASLSYEEDMQFHRGLWKVFNVA